MGIACLEAGHEWPAGLVKVGLLVLGPGVKELVHG